MGLHDLPGLLDQGELKGFLDLLAALREVLLGNAQGFLGDVGHVLRGDGARGVGVVKGHVDQVGEGGVQVGWLLGLLRLGFLCLGGYVRVVCYHPVINHGPLIFEFL